MCWNAEISLNTFIFGCISAIIVYLLGVVNINIIIILLSFTSMQLLEYFIWKNMDDKKINDFLSKIGLLIIITQIILLCIFNKNYIIFLYFYLIFLTLFVIFELNKIKFETVIGENGHLRWKWLEFNIIWIIVGLSFYLITCSNIISFLFIFGTLLISIYHYYEYKTWGSMWCYISNIGWIYFIYYSIIIKIMDI